MAYIGNQTASNFNSIPSVQRFNGDGSIRHLHCQRQSQTYKIFLCLLMVLFKTQAHTQFQMVQH